MPDEIDIYETAAPFIAAGYMINVAPFPDILGRMVDAIEYRQGWSFKLLTMDRGQGSYGLTLYVVGTYPDTYNPEQMIHVAHLFPVPPAAYNERSWTRWLFDRLRDIETHESAEFFKLAGERPYAPHHGPGNDPYIVFDHHDPDDVKVRFDGTVAETGSSA